METTLTYLLCAGSAIWIADVIRGLASTRSGRNPDYAVQQTATEAFRAFQRVFSSREISFLAEHPKVARRLSRRLRRNRRQVFQTYLEQLRFEHTAASRDLRGLAVALDRSDLAREAVRRELGFSTCYWLLRIQLATGLPITPRALSWAGMPKARPARAVEAGAAYAELERTAVR
jgi:hypothetical protein